MSETPSPAPVAAPAVNGKQPAAGLPPEPPSVAAQVDGMAAISPAQLRQIEHTRVVRGPLLVQQTFRIIDLDAGTELRTLTSDALNNGQPVAVVGSAEGWAQAQETLDGMFAYLEEDLHEARRRAARKGTEPPTLAPRRGRKR